MVVGCGYKPEPGRQSLHIPLKLLALPMICHDVTGRALLCDPASWTHLQIQIQIHRQNLGHRLSAGAPGPGMYRSSYCHLSDLTITVTDCATHRTRPTSNEPFKLLSPSVPVTTNRPLLTCTLFKFTIISSANACVGPHCLAPATTVLVTANLNHDVCHISPLAAASRPDVQGQI